MHNLKKLFLLAFLILTTHTLLAKRVSSKNAASLVCDYKKLGGENEYELIFHLNLQKGWFVKADNDYDSVSLKLPQFTFDNSDRYKTEGKVESKGLIETKRIRRAGIVNMYSYTVLYSQKITAQPGTTINGTLKYQVCTEKKAKRTKTEKFSVKIK